MYMYLFLYYNTIITHMNIKMKNTRNPKLILFIFKVNFILPIIKVVKENLIFPANVFNKSSENKNKNTVIEHNIDVS